MRWRKPHVLVELRTQVCGTQGGSATSRLAVAVTMEGQWPWQEGPRPPRGVRARVVMKAGWPAGTASAAGTAPRMHGTAWVAVVGMAAAAWGTGDAPLEVPAERCEEGSSEGVMHGVRVRVITRALRRVRR